MGDKTLTSDELFGNLDNKEKSYSVFGYTIYVIIILLVLFMALFGYFIAFIQVEGDSMLDTIEQDQFIIFQKRGYKLEHGDIITVTKADPDEPSKILIKRLIALGGDTFMFMKNENPRFVDLYICKNGETRFSLCDEPYIRNGKMSAAVNYNHFSVAPYIDHITEVDLSDPDSHDPEIRDILATSAVTVPEYNFMFLGDNRDISLDSREYGIQPQSKISGKAVKFLEKSSFMHKLLNFLYN